MKINNLIFDEAHHIVGNTIQNTVFNYDELEIKICNDAGRLTRPVFKLRNNQTLLDEHSNNLIMNKKLKWDDLLTDHEVPESVLEYIDF